MVPGKDVWNLLFLIGEHLQARQLKTDLEYPPAAIKPRRRAEQPGRGDDMIKGQFHHELNIGSNSFLERPF